MPSTAFTELLIAFAYFTASTEYYPPISSILALKRSKPVGAGESL